MLDKNQTLKNQSVITHIGLEENEVSILKTLCNSEIRLNEKFILKELDREKSFDVVFINGDSELALAEWKAIANKHSEAIPVVLSSENEFPHEYQVLQKPLQFKLLLKTLQSLTATPNEDIDDPDIDINTAKILVVDDSFPARQFMKFKLDEIIPDSLHIKVEFADSGDKAITIIKSKPVDLVFLDVTMPGKDGYEICRLIKQNCMAQVAMLTGLNEKINELKGKQAGCDYYLTKPPQDEDLLQVINSTFNWRDLKNN